VLTSAGSVPVVAPRVNDKWIDPETGERQRFSSAILPPWARKTPRIDEVLLAIPSNLGWPLAGRSCGMKIGSAVRVTSFTDRCGQPDL